MKKLFFALLILLSLSIAFDNVVPVSNISYAEDEEDEDREDEDHDEEDEEDEREEEDEDREDDDREEYEVITYETVEIPQNETIIYTEVPAEQFENVVRYISIVDLGFDVDTDGDKLVDALDPDPTIPQQQLYTDGDGDSVPDAYDRYAGKDDYSYQEFADANNNGILDLFENLN